MASRIARAVIISTKFTIRRGVNLSKKKNKPKFRCKSDAQKKAIAANYARMAAQKRHSTPPSQQPKSQPKKEFKLPLNNGGRRWNIFRVPNSILGGKQDNDVHGGLVLDEMNDNYLLVQVTHSPKKGKRNNLQIRNLNSSDFDKDGNLRQSFLERRLIVSIDTKDGEQGIDYRALNRQMNDLQFTEKEKQTIIDELSHLSTAEERYNKFVRLAKQKAEAAAKAATEAATEAATDAE